MMDKLWAPWRVKYITKIYKPAKGCIFCRMLKEKKDAQNYIFARTKSCFAVLNIYPYNNGHLLILPNRHVASLKKLEKHEKYELYDLIETCQSLLDETIKPQGYNIGINLGRVAGAGIASHLHFHLVPRWPGDSNFMPVTAQTKVISQSLNEVYKILKNAYKKRN